jgi:hypothetical protein
VFSSRTRRTRTRGSSDFLEDPKDPNPRFRALFFRVLEPVEPQESGGASSADVCPVAETLEEVDSSSDDAISDDESDSDDDDVDSS